MRRLPAEIKRQRYWFYREQKRVIEYRRRVIYSYILMCVFVDDLELRDRYFKILIAPRLSIIRRLRNSSFNNYRKNFSASIGYAPSH